MKKRNGSHSLIILYKSAYILELHYIREHGECIDFNGDGESEECRLAAFTLLFKRCLCKFTQRFRTGVYAHNVDLAVVLMLKSDHLK